MAPNPVELTWKVVVLLRSREDAKTLRHRLAQDGVPASRFLREVVVGAPGPGEAEALADRLRRETVGVADYVRTGPSSKTDRALLEEEERKERDAEPELMNPDYRAVFFVEGDPRKKVGEHEFADAVSGVETSGPHRRYQRRVVYAYAATNERAQDAAQALPERLNATGFVVQEVSVERWNPATQSWQDPELPVGPRPSSEEERMDQLDTAAWEVRIKSHDGRALRRARSDLEARGIACVRTGLQRLSVLAEREEQARALADELFLQFPFASEVTPERLSKHRRWLMKQLKGLNFGSETGG